MNILEKELEDLIWEAIQDKRFSELRKRGLWLFSGRKYFRQFNFGSYGIADICALRVRPTVDLNENIIRQSYTAEITIIELKKDEINTKTLLQAANYARAAQVMVKEWESKSRGKLIYAEINIILIGKKICTKDSFPFLSDIFHDLKLLTYELDFFDGLSFKKQKGYRHTNETLPKYPFIGSEGFSRMY